MSELARRTVIGGMAAGLAAGPATAAPVKVGQSAPDFRLTTFAREEFTRDSLAGQVVVLNYWATWCAPCRVEMPLLDAYLRRHPGTDLRIFAVATEGSVPLYKLKPLSDVLAFPLVRKLSGKGYGINGGLPTNYVIGRDGVVRHAASGAFSYSQFDALVTPLLAAKA